MSAASIPVEGSARDEAPTPAAVGRSVGFGLLALYLLLGFSAGLPFYMFSTVLALRLEQHGVGLVVIGFFAWVTLLPTFKFAWAPLMDRYTIPGFTRFWGKRRGWIMLAQIGICLSTVALGLWSGDRSLPLTALFATLLAFWTTTLEVAADAWRIELAPTQEEQGPLVAANLWGYRTAMVAAGSGALIVADRAGWTVAYLVIAAAAFLPLPLLVAARPEVRGAVGRGFAFLKGLVASGLILALSTVGFAAVGWLLLRLAVDAGVGAHSNVTPVVLLVCMLPFILMAIALPRIRRAPPDAPIRTSTLIGPYTDFFWRFGYGALPLLFFVSLYRMGDVLTLTLSKPLLHDTGYTLTQIGVADGAVALISSMVGVALGGWMVARWRDGLTLTIGAFASAIGNWIFVWLAHRPPTDLTIDIATGLDQFGHGLAGAVFVVYLSMLVNPRHPGAQYAFLSGFAFLLPRLLAGASGSIHAVIGYDGFFVLSGALSMAAVLFLPLVVRIRPRPSDEVPA